MLYSILFLEICSHSFIILQLLQSYNKISSLLRQLLELKVQMNFVSGTQGLVPCLVTRRLSGFGCVFIRKLFIFLINLFFYRSDKDIHIQINFSMRKIQNSNSEVECLGVRCYISLAGDDPG